MNRAAIIGAGAKVSLATILQVGRAVMPPPASWERPVETDEAKTQAAGECWNVRAAITAVAGTCAALDCVRVLVVAAQAELRCAPVRSHAVRLHGAERVGDWYAGFTTKIHATTTAATRALLENATQCRAAQDETRRCLGPAGGVALADPRQAGGGGRPGWMRRGEPAPSLSVDAWDGYVAFLTKDREAIEPLLVLYPGLAVAMTAELNSVRGAEAGRRKACEAAVTSGATLDPPATFFSKLCTDKVLSVASLTAVRQQYQAAYDAQEAKLKAQEEARRQREAEREAELERQREQKLASHGCKVATARLDYCTFVQQHDALDKQLAQQTRLDRVSGTTNPAARRQLVAVILQASDAIKGTRAQLAKLKAGPPGSCSKMEALKAAQETACTAPEPTAPAADQRAEGPAPAAPPITNRTIRGVTVQRLLAAAGWVKVKKQPGGRGTDATFCGRSPAGDDVASKCSGYCAKASSIQYGDATRDGVEEALVVGDWDCVNQGGSANGSVHVLLTPDGKKLRVVWRGVYDKDGDEHAEGRLLKTKLLPDALVVERYPHLQSEDAETQVTREVFAGVSDGKLVLRERTQRVEPPRAKGAP